jgi:SAM-dependent methyltransferase
MIRTANNHARNLLARMRQHVAQPVRAVCQLPREHKMLAHINKLGEGIEIGPSFRPIAPKKKGFKVTIIDHASREELMAKYGAQGIDCSQIEQVDHVWDGKTYAELTGRRHHYDWILASHVIEHTTDLIGFLQQCEEILRPNGCLSLAVPDKRYCFDRLRPKTGLARVIDAHRQPSALHSEGTVAEYFLNVVRYKEGIAWDRRQTLDDGEFAFVHSGHETFQAVKTARQRSHYLDVHAWTFTPNSFRLIVHDLGLLGHTSLKETAFYETEGHEFFVTLCKTDEASATDRMALAQASLREGY